MTRSEFIKLMAEKCKDWDPEQTERGVRALLEELKKSLEDGKRIEIRNFGSFTTKQSTSRVGANPRTGEKIQFGSHKVVHFKCGRNFHKLANDMENEFLSSLTSDIEPVSSDSSNEALNELDEKKSSEAKALSKN